MCLAIAYYTGGICQPDAKPCLCPEATFGCLYFPAGGWSGAREARQHGEIACPAWVFRVSLGQRFEQFQLSAERGSSRRSRLVRAAWKAKYYRRKETRRDESSLSQGKTC